MQNLINLLLVEFTLKQCERMTSKDKNTFKIPKPKLNLFCVLELLELLELVEKLFFISIFFIKNI